MLDDGIGVQVVSCDAVEEDTVVETGMLGQRMEQEETLGMEWLTKHHTGYLKHTPTYIPLGICLTCHFLPLKSLEVRTFLSSDAS